ncbi:MAG: hypothetical protein KIT22_00730 [Verrucomicrobiae bacterium]|nr:hypothetical protein [Verrucomicrobiae bacterium]
MLWPSRYISLVLLPLDAIAVVMVFNLVGRIRGVLGEDHWVITPLLLPLALVMICFYLIDGYRSRTDMLSLSYTSEHLIALFLCLLVTMLLTFVLIPRDILQQSRAVVALSFALMPRHAVLTGAAAPRRGPEPAGASAGLCGRQRRPPDVRRGMRQDSPSRYSTPGSAAPGRALGGFVQRLSFGRDPRAGRRSPGTHRERNPEGRGFGAA